VSKKTKKIENALERLQGQIDILTEALAVHLLEEGGECCFDKVKVGDNPRPNPDVAKPYYGCPSTYPPIPPTYTTTTTAALSYESKVEALEEALEFAEAELEEADRQIRTLHTQCDTLEDQRDALRRVLHSISIGHEENPANVAWEAIQ
jgi:hypothetical protein